MEMTGEKAIETACVAAIEAALPEGIPCQIVPFVASMDRERTEVRYPCVSIRAEPFQPVAPGANFGSVPLFLSVRTSADRDPDRANLEALWEAASGAMVAATIGSLVPETWVLCGIDDSGDAGTDIDEQEKTAGKSRLYRMAVTVVTEQ